VSGEVIRRHTYGEPRWAGNPIIGIASIDARENTDKSDPVSLDTVWTTMTAAKEAGHEGQGAKANHDSWQ
jgi:hypothetical protein